MLVKFTPFIYLCREGCKFTCNQEGVLYRYGVCRLGVRYKMNYREVIVIGRFMEIILFSFLLSFVMVAYMLPKILLLSLRKRLVDAINVRKVHAVPASRLGGLAFFPAIAFSFLIGICLTNQESISFIPTIELTPQLILEVLSLILLFLVGVYDDILGVNYKYKFAVQILAAALLVWGGIYIQTLHGLFGIYEIPAYIGVPLTMLFFVFVTNAINLIDGIDGLASLLSIMALVVYSIVFYNRGAISESMMSLTTVGALAPFCYNNIFGVKRGIKSKIFMGDTGALVIGAILGFSSVKLWNMTGASSSDAIDQLYYILAFTMLLVPCLDVVRIILHRYRIKKPLFKPDKNHIHHKFMALGYSPRQALMFIVAINFSFLALNIALSYLLNITFIVIVDVVVWTTMHLYITKKINTKSK